MDLLPENMRRQKDIDLPEVSQYHVLQHYLRLSQMTMGMDLGADIGEGTCTMKYSPKMHDQVVNSSKFADLHPMQPEETLQGILEIVYGLEQYLKQISDGEIHLPAGRRLPCHLYKRLPGAEIP